MTLVRTSWIRSVLAVTTAGLIAAGVWACNIQPQPLPPGATFERDDGGPSKAGPEAPGTSLDSDASATGGGATDGDAGAPWGDAGPSGIPDAATTRDAGDGGLDASPDGDAGPSDGAVTDAADGGG